MYTSNAKSILNAAHNSFRKITFYFKLLQCLWI